METETSASGIKSAITKRYGPLPLWGWAAVVVGGAVVFMLVRKRVSGGATGTQEQGIGFGSSTGGGGGGGILSNIPPHDGTVITNPGAGGQGSMVDTALRIAHVPSGMNIAGGDPAIRAAYDVATTIGDFKRTVGSHGGVMITALHTDAQNRSLVTQLTSRGYTAGYYGGKVYAARNNQEFFSGLPADARANLAKLLTAKKAA